MTKSQLIDAVARRAGLTHGQAADALAATLDSVQEVLGRGGEVALSGFGRFHVAERAARPGNNPRTGEPMYIDATRTPRFTAGSNLKKAVRRAGP